MRTIAQILQQQIPLCNRVDAATTAEEAFNLMRCLHCEYIIVGSVNYEGLITEGDYLRKYLLSPSKGPKLLAGDIMNVNIPIVYAQDTVKRCLKLMDQFGTHYLPVFNESEFMSVITMSQLIKDVLLYQKLETDV